MLPNSDKSPPATSLSSSQLVIWSNMLNRPAAGGEKVEAWARVSGGCARGSRGSARAGALRCHLRGDTRSGRATRTGATTTTGRRWRVQVRSCCRVFGFVHVAFLCVFVLFCFHGGGGGCGGSVRGVVGSGRSLVCLLCLFVCRFLPERGDHNTAR